MSDSRPPVPPHPEAGVAAPARPVDTIPRVFGRYRVLALLGKGGMGAVYRAHDTQLDRTVALKVPFLGRDNNPDARQRFFREARAAAALHHPNICPVYDVGEHQGLPYLTMAYIEGRSLAQVVAGPPLPFHHAALLVRKIALGMQEAHARGVIHRDLKPANVLLRATGEPVVMDFGLARRGDDQTEGLTRQGDVIGTLEYMSPEQIDGDNAAVGPAADVYALGVVLFELLTGRRPFAGTTTAKMAAILLKPPPRPGDLRPGVPARLEDICLKAMARRPEDRFASMAEFAAALADYLRSPQPAPVPAVPAPPAAEVPTKPPGATPRITRAEPAPEEPPTRVVVRAKLASGAKKKPKKDRSYLPWAIGGAVAAVCLTVLAAALILQPRDRVEVAAPAPPPPAEPTPPAKPAPAPATQPRPNPAGPTRPAPASPPAAAAPVLRCRPDGVALAVGEQREVTVEIDRRGQRGPVVVRWDAPTWARVSPAGPVTVKPSDPDPVLTVRLTATPGADARVRVTARADRGDAATAEVSVRANPGPCERLVELPDATGDAVAFTPDAAVALVGSAPARKDGQDAGAIRAWDLARGEPTGALAGHAARVTGLVVAADGKAALSTAADDTVALWDVPTARRVWLSPRQPGRVVAVAVSPDARRGLALYPGLLVKVDLDKFRSVGAPIKFGQLTASARDDQFRTAAVSSKGQGLVGGADGKLFLLDLSDRVRPRPLAGHRDDVQCAAFAPAGESAATGGGTAVYLWDVKEAALAWRAEGHARPVVAVAFSPDGKFVASGGADGEVRVWSAADGKPVATLAGHAGRVLALTFAADGGLWSAAADKTLRKWRLP